MLASNSRNQDDYDRLEELTLELLELREQHECKREVVENHNKDINKVKRYRCVDQQLHFSGMQS